MLLMPVVRRAQDRCCLGHVYSLLIPSADVLNVDSVGLENLWSITAATKELIKFAGGFYVGKLALPQKSSYSSGIPNSNSVLAELPKSLYGGIDTLALPNDYDDSEKMLLFPESVIKAAVDTLKEVAIDDFKAELYERAVKHLTVRHRRTNPTSCLPPSTRKTGEEEILRVA